MVIKLDNINTVTKTKITATDNKRTNLNCMYCNTRSIMNNNKREEIEYYLQANNIDILGITESWTHTQIKNEEIQFVGYQLFRKDRVNKEKVRGGGVLLYIKDNLKATLIEEVNSLGETCWVKLQDRENKTLCIGVCYRSPDCSRKEWEDISKEIKKYTRTPTLLMGDFNYRDINWETGESGRLGEEFLDLVNDCFLFQHVNCPTRERNILDLVLSTEVNMVEDLEVREPVSNSDHNQILWKLNWKTVIESPEQKQYDYNKGDYKGLLKKLGKENWENLLANKNVEEMWAIVLKLIIDGRDEYIPEKIKTKRKYPPWMKYKLRKLLKKRYHLWKKFTNEPDYTKHIKYKKMRDTIRTEIKAAKKEFEEKLANNIKEDPKSFYHYVRTKQRTKVKVGPLNDDKGGLITEDEEMCELLNTYFGSVFTVEDTSNLPEVTSRTNEKLNNIEITEEKVRNGLNKIKRNKSAGDDGVTSSFLKAIASEIVKPLTLIFQESLRSGTIPSDWKNANVTAIHKQGSYKKPQNYRPISLTSQISKLMERLIKDEMIRHLETNKLLNESQHGFRSNKSCLTNLLDFMEEVSESIDQGKPVDVLYLDFQKAFDKVPHGRLIAKLKSHGIDGEVVRWVEEWLRNRKQRWL